MGKRDYNPGTGRYRKAKEIRCRRHSMRDDAEPPLSRSSIPLFQHVFSHEIVLLFRIVLYAKSAIAETRRDLVLKGKGSNRALERAPAARFDLVFPVSSASSQPLLPPPPPPPPPALTLSLSLSLFHHTRNRRRGAEKARDRARPLAGEKLSVAVKRENAQNWALFSLSLCSSRCRCSSHCRWLPSFLLTLLFRRPRHTTTTTVPAHLSSGSSTRASESWSSSKAATRPARGASSRGSRAL